MFLMSEVPLYWLDSGTDDRDRTGGEARHDVDVGARVLHGTSLQANLAHVTVKAGFWPWLSVKEIC